MLHSAQHRANAPPRTPPRDTVASLQGSRCAAVATHRLRQLTTLASSAQCTVVPPQRSCHLQCQPVAPVQWSLRPWRGPCLRSQLWLQQRARRRAWPATSPARHRSQRRHRLTLRGLPSLPPVELLLPARHRESRLAAVVRGRTLDPAGPGGTRLQAVAARAVQALGRQRGGLLLVRRGTPRGRACAPQVLGAGALLREEGPPPRR